MKNFLRFFLLFILLILLWQFSRSFYSQHEQELRQDIRAGFEKEFQQQANISRQRFGLKPLEQTRSELPHIVLIHGLDDPGKVWMNLAPKLVGENYNVWIMTYPNDQKIIDSAEMFHQELVKLNSQGIHRISVVAHSMGGLVSREILTNPAMQCVTADCVTGKRPHINQLIMVGTPNHGSVMARFRVFAEIREQLERFISGEAAWLDWIFDGAGEAGIDLVPGSKFLAELNSRPHPRLTRYHLIAGIIGDEERLKLKNMLLKNTDQQAIASLIDSLLETIGDGLVTLESATLAGIPTDIVAGNHLSIIRNITSSSRRVPPAIPVIIKLLAEKSSVTHDNPQKPVPEKRGLQ